MATQYVKKLARSGMYQYQRRVPNDVQKAFGSRWVQRSLNTADPREARKRASITTAELDRQWDVLRGTATPLQRWQQGSSWLAQQEPLEFGADDMDEQTGEPIFNTNNPSQWAYDELERVQEGTATIPTGATPAAYGAWLAGQRTIPAPDVMLEDALDLWTKERKPVKSARDGATRVVEQFSQLTGNAPMNTVTRVQARQYRDSLVAAGAAPGTIETYVSYLRTVFGNAIREGLIADRVNPFSALKIERTKIDVEERVPIPRATCLQVLQETLRPGFDQSDWFAAAMLTTGARPGGLYKARLVLDGKTPHWAIPREKKSPPRVVPVHPRLLEALKDGAPPRFTVRVEQLRRSFIERYKPYVAYQCRHSFNDEARRVDMPLELRLRIMGHSARKFLGENARYGSIEAVLHDAPRWISSMWR